MSNVETWWWVGCLSKMHVHMIMHMDWFLSCDLDSNLYLRLVLACIIVVAVHGFFVIEQPRQTHLFNYFRWQWFQEKNCYASCLIKWCNTCMHAWFLVGWLQLFILHACRYILRIGGWCLMDILHRKGSKLDQTGLGFQVLIWEK